MTKARVNRKLKSITVIGKGYVDGAHDNDQACPGMMPTISIAGLLFSRMLQIPERMLGAKSLKGGDPAAGSPTATLLRLHPSL
jgi:hypothetical protein